MTLRSTFLSTALASGFSSFISAISRLFLLGCLLFCFSPASAIDTASAKATNWQPDWIDGTNPDHLAVVSTSTFHSEHLSTNDIPSVNGTSNNNPVNQVGKAGGESNGATKPLVADHPDYQPLVDLYNSTDGPNWLTRQGWLANTNPCNGWYGVTCTEGRVTRINLSSNRLNGTIPASLGNLVKLNTLLLAQNSLGGSIPASLGNLTALTDLALSGNRLSGSMPAGLGSLINLQGLNLAENQLSGSIPVTFASFSKLEYFYLNNNELSGTIPSTLGSLSSLRNLQLGNNQLSGGIPSGLGSLASLEILDMNNNLLTSIPSSFEKLTKLERLFLENNQITSIPSNMGNMTNLRFLDLGNNQITGSIPSNLGNMTNLESLRLANNRLSGSIPSSLSKLTRLGYLLLNDNQLSGCYPASLSALCGTTTNFWGNEGLPPFPTFCDLGHGSDAYVPLATASASSVPVGKDVTLSTAGDFRHYIWQTASDGVRLNDVFDPVVTATLTTPGLKVFTVDIVHGGTCSQTATVSVTALAVVPTISGLRPTPSTACPGGIVGFAATVGNITGSYVYTLTNGSNPVMGTSSSPAFSQTLVASGSGSQSFTLTISSGGGSARATTALTVGTGGHPDYQALVDLYNSTNGPGWANKTGWFTNCDPCNNWYGVACTAGRVTGIDLSINQLKGTIPVSIGSFANLQSLALHHNELSGSIPSTLTNLTKLTELALYNNQLTGSIPSTIGNLINLESLNFSDNQLTGSIPSSFGSLSKLSNLRMENNQLSGSIPSSLGSFSNLIYLFLSNNQFSGSIPTSLGSLSKLLYLGFHTNQLSGSIPSSLGSLSNLQYLYLYNNQLSGCYPNSLRALCGINQIGFSGNPGLPGGGYSDAMDAFCATGQGGDAFVPTARASSSSLPVGGVVSLSITGGSSYSWKAPAGALLSGTSSGVVSATLTSAGPKTFTVVVSQGGTCSQTATVSVNATVVTPTLSGFAATPASVCAGSVATFTATVGNITGNYSYTLTNGAAINLQGSRSIIPFSQNVTIGSATSPQIFTLTVNSGGGSRSTTTSLSVKPLPNAAFSGLNASYCANANPVTLVPATAGGTFSGPGVSGTTFTPSSAGSGGTITYSVTVNGCISTSSQNVTVTPLPIATISPSSASLTCTSPTVSLTASGGGTYQWDNNSTNAVRTITTAGTYSVTVTAGNGCTATASRTISGNSTPPTVSISPSSASLSCASPSVSLSAVGNGAVLWSTGATTPTIAVTTAGTYSVTLTSGGCSATASVGVTGSSTPPTVTVSPANPTLSCASPSVSLSAVGNGAVLWSTGATTPTITVTAAGTYSVTLTSGGCSATASVGVTGSSTPPTVTVSPANPTLSCASPSVSLSAVGNGAVLWSTGATTPTIAVTTAGTYSVTLTSGGCSATASVGVTGSSTPPTVTVSPANPTLSCASPSVSLSAVGNGAVLWSTGATTPTIAVTTAGTYSVTLTSGGCSATASVGVTGEVSTPPVPNLTSTNVTQGSPEVTLTASNCGGTINWTGPENTAGTGTITVSTGSAGTFSYQATCSANGCNSETASVVVVVTAVTVPTVNGSFDGFIYGADCSTFRGWVWDRNKPNTPISVDILDGTNVIATLIADVLRQDLVDGGKGNGRHAFIWSIPESLKDGLPHSLSARVTGNSFVLKNSPKVILCQTTANPSGNKPPQPPVPFATLVAQVGVSFSASLAAFTDPEAGPLAYVLTGLPAGMSFEPTTRTIGGTPTEAGSFALAYQATDALGANNSTGVQLTVYPGETTPVTGSFEGYLDKLDCGGIRGWVWDRNKPNTPLTVEFYLEPSPGVITVLGSTLASIYRVDLKEAGKGNGAHAYNFTPPGSVTNGTMVMARVLGSSFVLKGSPRAYQCTSPARVSAETKAGLEVMVLGNPVMDQLALKVRGVEGQPLQLVLTDANGRLIDQRQIEKAGAVEWPVFEVRQQAAGLLLLRVSSGAQTVTRRILKP